MWKRDTVCRALICYCGVILFLQLYPTSELSDYCGFKTKKYISQSGYVNETQKSIISSFFSCFFFTKYPIGLIIWIIEILMDKLVLFFLLREPFLSNFVAFKQIHKYIGASSGIFSGGYFFIPLIGLYYEGPSVLCCVSNHSNIQFILTFNICGWLGDFTVHSSWLSVVRYFLILIDAKILFIIIKNWNESFLFFFKRKVFLLLKF